MAMRPGHARIGDKDLQAITDSCLSITLRS